MGRSVRAKLLTEVPKVFLNSSVKPASGGSNDTYTLVTAPADATYVIKSLDVPPLGLPTTTTGDPVSLKLYADGTEIGNLASSEGEETLAPGTSLTAKITPAVSLPTLEYATGENASKSFVVTGSSTSVGVSTLSLSITKPSGNYEYDLTETALIQKYFDGGYGGTPTGYNGEKTIPTFVDTTSTKWYYETATDAFYHYCNGNNSTTRLYTAPKTGDTVGAWSQVWAKNYVSAALDLSQPRCVYVEAQAIKEYNFITKTETTLFADGNVGTNGLTYHSTAIVNNVLFWIEDSSDLRRFFSCDLTTGTGRVSNSVATADGFITGSDGQLAAAYNPVDGKYYLIYATGTSRSAYRLDSLSSFTFLGRGTDTSIFPNSAGDCHFIIGNNKGEFFHRSANSEILKLENSLGTVTATYTTVAGVTPDRNRWYITDAISPTTQVTEPLDFQTGVLCRISGTEVKEIN